MYFETAQQCSFTVQQVFICYSVVALYYIVLTLCLQVSEFFKIIEGGRSMFSCKNEDNSGEGEGCLYKGFSIAFH